MLDFQLEEEGMPMVKLYDANSVEKRLILRRQSGNQHFLFHDTTACRQCTSTFYTRNEGISSLC